MTMRTGWPNGVSVCAVTVFLAGLTLLLVLPTAPPEGEPAGSGDAADISTIPADTRGAPEILLIPDFHRANAAAEPGEDGSVLFTGVVRINSSGMYDENEHFRIQLTVDMQQGWASTISPSSIATQVGQNTSFRLTCRVPPAVSSSVTGKLVLGGTCTPYSSPATTAATRGR